jgi:hypothetical protein
MMPDLLRKITDCRKNDPLRGVFDRRFVRLNGETAPASVVFNGHVRGFHVASRQVVAVPFPSSIDSDRPHR